MQNLYIVTGASRGLGEALVTQLLQPGNRILCISRTTNDRLRAKAENEGVLLDWVEKDLALLSEEGESESFLEKCLGAVQLNDIAKIRLINNAGVLEPIGPAHMNESGAVGQHIAINLTAPILLTSALLRITASISADKRVMQISSGAGRKPYAGWSAYCAAKAGLDHFTRCLKLEQDEIKHGARVASVAPGVIDTDMQALIRGAGEERFPSHSRFVKMHEMGELISPSDAASRLLQYLESQSFGVEPIVDIRDLK
ncbi:SDR family NAD(P)-dependent oxidoreductase [Marinicrinis lubricantis]|uniref:SDR family NAD(P)-dependent oxidoreductase n=1 Tax=Marinicrinis lubricantis TaxID=2086470 RepID=A0ABW1ITF0_9BACL